MDVYVGSLVEGVQAAAPREPRCGEQIKIGQPCKRRSF